MKQLHRVLGADNIVIPDHDQDRSGDGPQLLQLPARQWVRAGGKLFKDDGIRQFLWIKYKVSTDTVLQIEPKEDLKKRSGKRRDYAEAFMLTFTPQPPAPNIRSL